MIKKEFEKLKEWYSKELRKRDKQIDELKEKNILLMKTSFKQSQRLEELKKRIMGRH
ncbi:hypothetical protein ISS04_03375 [Candidatus Woesearchaeota archaeon]|nr:hypothetical protein [Candidatus Woesearchaeota archaeon]